MTVIDMLTLRERAECLVPEDRVQFAIDQLAVRMAVNLARKNPLVLPTHDGDTRRPLIVTSVRLAPMPRRLTVA